MPLSSLRDALLERDEGAENISDMPLWRVGMSMTASWAWGISIAIGITIMHSKGILPFIVWVVPNVLAIPFIALTYSKIPDMKKWAKWTPFLVFLLLSLMYALLLNMQFINLALSGGTDLATFGFIGEGTSLYVVLATGLLVTLYINKKGLRGSALTDVGQYSIQILGTLALVIAGLVLGTRADVSWMVQGTTNWWITVSGIATLFSIIDNGAQWQRLEALTSNHDRLKAGLYGGLFFGGYMALVTVAGFLFEGTMIMSLIFLVIVFTVATSTMDSAISAIQWVFKRFGQSPQWGTGLAIMTVLGWPLLIGSPVTSIYQTWSNFQVRIIGGLLVFTALYSAAQSSKIYELASRYQLVMDHQLFEE